MATTNLNIAEVTVGQSQKEVTINAASDQIDKAFGTLVSLTIGASNALTLTSAQFRENFSFIFTDDGSPPTAVITLTVPAIARGTVAITNNTSFTMTVTIASQPVTAPVVDVGTTRLIVTDGVNVRASAGGVSTFTSLSDSPSSYVSQKGKITVVNQAESALEFGPNIISNLSSSSFKQSFNGALIERSSTLSLTTSTDTIVPWQTVDHDVTFTNDSGVTNQKFWLGVDLTFTAATTDIVTATGHLMTNGDGPLQLTTSGTLPAGLALTTNYWVIFIDTNTFKLATTRALALAGTAVDVTDTGSGTHTLDRETRLVVPEGVTRIRLIAGARFDANATGTRTATFKKNDSFTFAGRVEVSDSAVGSAVDRALPFTSPVMTVVLGDYFTVNVFQSSGGALNLETDNTFFSIEVIESDIVVPFPAILVEDLSRGALAHMTSSQSIASSTNVPLEWDVVNFDTGFGGSNFFTLGSDDTIITIPAGVTQVQLYAGAINAVGHSIRLERDTGGGFAFENILPQAGNSTSSNGTTNNTFTSGLIDVATGDKFRIIARNTSSGTVGILHTYFGIRITQTNQILTFPGVTVTRPNIGALVKRDAVFALTASANSNDQVPWESAVYDTGFKGAVFAEFVTNPSRITIPAGITKVRLTGSAIMTANFGSSGLRRGIDLYKNGSKLDPGGFSQQSGPQDGLHTTAVSAVIEVVATDYFELNYFNEDSSANNLSANSTWLSIEVIETTDDVFPPEQVETVLLADSTALLTSRIQYKKVAARRFSLNDEFLTSSAHAETAPTSTSQIFDVKRDGSIIGTITFAVASQTATFATTGGSQEDFEVGERLTIETQGSVNTVIRDISINLFAFRT